MYMVCFLAWRKWVQVARDIIESYNCIKYVSKYINNDLHPAIYALCKMAVNWDIMMMSRKNIKEALLMIFNFPIHLRHTAIIHLILPLGYSHRLIFTKQTSFQRALLLGSPYLLFMSCNIDEDARKVLYWQLIENYMCKWDNEEMQSWDFGNSLRYTTNISRMLQLIVYFAWTT